MRFIASGAHLTVSCEQKSAAIADARAGFSTGIPGCCCKACSRAACPTRYSLRKPPHARSSFCCHGEEWAHRGFELGLIGERRGLQQGRKGRARSGTEQARRRGKSPRADLWFPLEKPRRRRRHRSDERAREPLPGLASTASNRSAAIAPAISRHPLCLRNEETHPAVGLSPIEGVAWNRNLRSGPSTRCSPRSHTRADRPPPRLVGSTREKARREVGVTRSALR